MEEEMMMMMMRTKKQTSMYNYSSSATASSPALGMHKNSHTISKVIVKPKIRIIHIFAPEIIKTDVANFRELVQRLTGKPPTTTTPDDEKIICSQKKVVLPRKNNISSTTFTTTCTRPAASRDDIEEEPKMIKKMEQQQQQQQHQQLRFGFRGFDSRDHHQRIKEEEEIWRGTSDINSISGGGGGFLSGFADLDGFMQELGGDFPNLLPCEASSHHMHHVFGETQLLS